MKIDLLCNITHGERGQAPAKEYARGLYQTRDEKAENYLPESLAELFLRMRNSSTGKPLARRLKAS